MLNPSIISAAKLNLRFKTNRIKDDEAFLRELREYILATDARMSQLEALVLDLQDRITALEA